MKLSHNNFAIATAMFALALAGFCVSQAHAGAEFTESFESFIVGDPWTAVSPWTDTGATDFGISGTEASDGVQSIVSSTHTASARVVQHDDTTLPIKQVTYDYRTTIAASATQGLYFLIGNGAYNAVEIVSANGGLLMEGASGQVAVGSGGGVATGWHSVIVQFAQNGSDFQARASLDGSAFTAWDNVKTYYSITGGFGADDLKTIRLQAYNGAGQFDNISAFVPEPASVALLGLGVMALASRRRTSARSA